MLYTHKTTILCQFGLFFVTSLLTHISINSQPFLVGIVSSIIPKMRLNCVKIFGARLVGATKTREGYTCRSIGNAAKGRTSYMWNVAMNSNLNFTRPHPGVVLWIRIGGVKHMHRNAPVDHLTGPCWPSSACPAGLARVPLDPR